MSLLCKLIIANSMKPKQNLFLSFLRYDSTSKASKLVEEMKEPVMLTNLNDDEETEEERESRIEKLRNKSRLNDHHRNIIHGKPPHPEPKAYFHESVRYQRRIWARYGSQNNIYPGILWPDKDDFDSMKEVDKILYSLSIQKMVEIEKDKLNRAEQEFQQRYKTISEKAKKNKQLIEDFYKREEEKQIALFESKQQKERLFNEIRKHFGYNIDPNDEKFQEMLEIKRKEEVKKRRLEKKKRKEEKFIATALEMEKQTVGKKEDNKENIKLVEKEINKKNQTE